MSKILFKNGRVHDAVKPGSYEADILVENGKIKKIAKNISAKGTEVVDLTGLAVFPGLVEAHGHTGMVGSAMGYEGSDGNEMNGPVTCEDRAIDGLNPMDPSLRLAAQGGVTTICTGPGSANVLGGTFTVIKPVGNCVDEMVVVPEVAMKCAFGENPKRCYQSKSISSRMTTAAKLREMLFKACEYRDKLDAAGDDDSKKPAFDIQLNALLPVVRGEMPLKAHAHQANDILTAIRIAKEFGVKLTLEHVTDGNLIVDQLVKAGVPVAIGPTAGQPSKIELKNKSWTTPGVLAKAGLNVSIITDCPVFPQHHLRFFAGMAIAAGMEPFDALKAITINAARHIGLEDRIGSIEVGKDADLVITDGCLFDVQTKILQTWIDGKKFE